MQLAYRYVAGRGNTLGTVGRLAFWGLVLSVVVLVVVLSVVNGFERELRQRVLGLLPHLSVDFAPGSQAQLRSLVVQLPAGALAAAPKVQGNALLISQGRIKGISVTGIDATYGEVSNLFDFIHGLQAEDFSRERYGVVLGEGVAAALALGVGDEVRIVVPAGQPGVAGLLPRQRNLKVTGILRSRSLLDAQAAYISLDLALKLFRLSAPEGVHLRLQDLFAVREPSADIYQRFDGAVRVRSWYDTYGNLYQAIAVQKLTMFLLLLFLVGVAAFNLVSGLVMIVEQRRTGVAILRTMGMSGRGIVQQFVILGCALAGVAILLGLLLGVVLSLSLPTLFAWLDDVQTGTLMSQYFISYLPVQVRPADLLQVGGVAFVLAFLATLFPAYRATRLEPSEVLNHE